MRPMQVRKNEMHEAVKIKACHRNSTQTLVPPILGAREGAAAVRIEWNRAGTRTMPTTTQTPIIADGHGWP